MNIKAHIHIRVFTCYSPYGYLYFANFNLLFFFLIQISILFTIVLFSRDYANWELIPCLKYVKQK